MSSYKRRGGLAPQRFGEADEFVRDLFDSLRDFLVGDALAVKRVARGKGEARNNDAAKIEHKAVGIRHDRHVTRVASGSANEANDLSCHAFPVSSIMFFVAAATS